MSKTNQDKHISLDEFFKIVQNEGKTTVKEFVYQYMINFITIGLILITCYVIGNQEDFIKNIDELTVTHNVFIAFLTVLYLYFILLIFLPWRKLKLSLFSVGFNIILYVYYFVTVLNIFVIFIMLYYGDVKRLIVLIFSLSCFMFGTYLLFKVYKKFSLEEVIDGLENLSCVDKLLIASIIGAPVVVIVRKASAFINKNKKD